MLENETNIIIKKIKKPSKDKTVKKLKSHINNYKKLIDVMSDGVIFLNLKGRVISANPAFFKLTGFSKKEIIGKHFTKLPTLRLVDIPKHAKTFTSLITKDAEKPTEFIWVHKDKSTRYGEFNSCLIKKNNKVSGIQVILKEITERKGKEIRLKQRKEELEYFYNMAIDREHKMIELKGEVNQLLEQLGKQKKYKA